jgi:hypothetical protein
MTAVMVYVPWVAWSGTTVVVALLIPALLCVLRIQRIEHRRVLAGVVLAFLFASYLSADVYVQPTCESCKLVEPGSVMAWMCWLIGC